MNQEAVERLGNERYSLDTSLKAGDAPRVTIGDIGGCSMRFV